MWLSYFQVRCTKNDFTLTVEPSWKLVCLKTTMCNHGAHATAAIVHSAAITKLVFGNCPPTLFKREQNTCVSKHDIFCLIYFKDFFQLQSPSYVSVIYICLHKMYCVFYGRQVNCVVTWAGVWCQVNCVVPWAGAWCQVNCVVPWAGVWWASSELCRTLSGCLMGVKWIVSYLERVSDDSVVNCVVPWASVWCQVNCVVPWAGV